MLVKIEARILSFPGTDFHFPSTSLPPSTFFRLCVLAIGIYLPGSKNSKSLHVQLLYTQTTWHYPHSPATRRPCSSRSKYPAQRAHSSKPAAMGCCCGPLMLQTDGRTPYRYIDPAAQTRLYRQCQWQYAD